MKTAIILLTFAAFLFNPPGVQAAAIHNLSNKTETIEVETTQGFAPVRIEAGRAWRVPGAVRVKFRERVLYIEDHEEYALWKDGTFGPQKVLRWRRS